MNFCDIIIIVVICLVTLGTLFLQFECIGDQEYGSAFGLFFIWLVVAGLLTIPFWVIDKHAGMTRGVITSVDENFFGTTAIFIKTSETTQEEYCIEDPGIAAIAYGAIGQEVTIKYGKRVGLYSTGDCSQAPVEYIGVNNEKE